MAAAAAAAAAESDWSHPREITAATISSSIHVPILQRLTIVERVLAFAAADPKRCVELQSVTSSWRELLAVYHNTRVANSALWVSSRFVSLPSFANLVAGGVPIDLRKTCPREDYPGRGPRLPTHLVIAGLYAWRDIQRNNVRAFSKGWTNAVCETLLLSFVARDELDLLKTYVDFVRKDDPGVDLSRCAGHGCALDAFQFAVANSSSLDTLRYLLTLQHTRRRDRGAPIFDYDANATKSTGRPIFLALQTARADTASFLIDKIWQEQKRTIFCSGYKRRQQQTEGGMTSSYIGDVRSQTRRFFTLVIINVVSCARPEVVRDAMRCAKLLLETATLLIPQLRTEDGERFATEKNYLESFAEGFNELLRMSKATRNTEQTTELFELIFRTANATEFLKFGLRSLMRDRSVDPYKLMWRTLSAEHLRMLEQFEFHLASEHRSIWETALRCNDAPLMRYLFRRTQERLAPEPEGTAVRFVEDMLCEVVDYAEKNTSLFEPACYNSDSHLSDALYLPPAVIFDVLELEIGVCLKNISGPTSKWTLLHFAAMQRYPRREKDGVQVPAQARSELVHELLQRGCGDHVVLPNSGGHTPLVFAGVYQNGGALRELKDFISDNENK